MFILNERKLFQEYCKSQKKWGMYISFYLEDNENWNDAINSAPYLENWKENDETMNLLLSESGYLFFETKEELEHHYIYTYGDDGYLCEDMKKRNCKIRIYALTCNNNGQFLNENT